MSEKRFTETLSTGIITDNETKKEYKCKYRIDDNFLELVNEIAKENEKMKDKIEAIDLEYTQNYQDFKKDTLYVNDTHTKIKLEDNKLYICIFIPKINEFVEFFYDVTGRRLEKEFSNLKELLAKSE